MGACNCEATRSNVNGILREISTSASIPRVCSKGVPHDLDGFTRVLTVNAIGTFNVLRLAAQR